MNARRLVSRARIVLYVGVIVVVVLFILRYDLLTLPEAGCSPIRAFASGDQLVVDRWVGTPELGDAVLFSAGPDDLLLGLVGEIPPSAPAGMHDAIAAGDLWLVIDEPNCPGRDSRVLGPVSVDDVVGRIRFALPW